MSSSLPSARAGTVRPPASPTVMSVAAATVWALHRTRPCSASSTKPDPAVVAAGGSVAPKGERAAGSTRARTATTAGAARS